MRAAILKKIPRKTVEIFCHPGHHQWNFFRNKCNVCRRSTIFLCDDATQRWIRKCIWCRSTPKYRAIVSVIEQHLGMPLSTYLQDGSRELYELTSTSPIHKCHYHRPNYVCSAYFFDKPFKKELAPRIWNEDIRDTHFQSESFDVIVSSETMEHVRRPWDGFKEIHRILKPGGIHFFTIPYRTDYVTRARIDTSGAADVDLMPRVYHQDPYRREDSLVYTDFGSDLAELLTTIGFRTTEHAVWEETTDIRDDLRPMRVFSSQKLPAKASTDEA